MGFICAIVGRVYYNQLFEQKIMDHKYNVHDFVWFRSGDYCVQAQILKIYTVTDDISTKVSYYILILDAITDFPFMVLSEDVLFESKIDLLKTIE